MGIFLVRSESHLDWQELALPPLSLNLSKSLSTSLFFSPFSLRFFFFLFGFLPSSLVFFFFLFGFCLPYFFSLVLFSFLPPFFFPLPFFFFFLLSSFLLTNLWPPFSFSALFFFLPLEHHPPQNLPPLPMFYGKVEVRLWMCGDLVPHF